MRKFLFIIIIYFKFISTLFAADHVINLVVDYKMVNLGGKLRKAIAVNNQIPAPTLHFKQGDHVSINVYNRLQEETAIHWHGVLVPWQMDGVLGVTQHGIQPGAVFHYSFSLYQAGTYWYHAHAGLQEQEGLYGAFLIDPPQPPSYEYNKDYVVVLSDWSNTPANQILANLKKEGDYYSPRFPLQPSLAKFIHDYRKASIEERKRLIDDYKMMQQMRMGIYDISDVAYDAFLLNGQSKCFPWTALVKTGDVVRLRFIGAGGSTIFHVKIPGTSMQMVHVQGNDVQPYDINDFTIAPGETYDVLVRIQKDDPYIIYAESIDTIGAAYGALITKPHQFVNYNQVAPFPEPLPVTREMISMMMGDMDHSSMYMQKHSSSKKATSSEHHSMSAMSHSMKNDPVNTTEHKNIMNHPMPLGNRPANIPESTKSDLEPAKSQSTETNRQNSSPLSKPMSHEEMGHDSATSNNSTIPMKMDPGMKMDETMPMDHSHNMNHQKTLNKTTDNPKKPESGITMSESHHIMSLMPKKSIPPVSNHAAHSMTAHKMKMNHSMSLHHTNMNMPTEPTRLGDSISAPLSTYKTSHGTKYQNMVAAVETNDPNIPIAGIINMELFGYMDRFIWFINGVPEYKAKPIILDPGKRYRIIFTNTSMMHHPMHIHGHWFILRNGNGAYDTLLHTIDVPPGATITADIDTDASGQWFFHCHLLYHMMTGMSRVLQYSSLIEIIKGEAKPQNLAYDTKYINRPIVRIDEKRPIDVSLVRDPMAHPAGFWLANFLNVGEDPFHNVQKLTFKGLYGGDYNKLELLVEDAEVNNGKVDTADIDIFYWRLISQFWAIKGGANYFYRPTKTPYWQPGIGVEGLMPYFIETDIRAYFHSGSAKLDLEFSRDTQITNNFFIRLGVRSILATKTVPSNEIGSGLNQMRFIIMPYYRVIPGLNIFIEYENEQDYGTFKSLQRNAGEDSSQNTLTFGLGLLF